MQDLTETARQYRKQLFEKFVEIGEGHPGSTFSMVEIVTTLFHGGHVKPGFDKVIVSKGHATVALYPILAKLGVLPQEEWDNWGKADAESCLRVFGNISIPGIDGGYPWTEKYSKDEFIEKLRTDDEFNKTWGGMRKNIVE